MLRLNRDYQVVTGGGNRSTGRKPPPKAPFTLWRLSAVFGVSRRLTESPWNAEKRWSTPKKLFLGVVHAVMVDANTTIGVFCAVPVRCVAMPGVPCRQTALNPQTMSALGGVRWRKVACLPPLSAVVTRQRGGSSRPCGRSSTLSGG